MRYRGLLIMIMFAMSTLVVFPTQPSTLTAQHSSATAKIALPKAKSTDRVPVIVTLKNTTGLERSFDSATTKAKRRKTVANLQNAFLSRQKSRIKLVKRKLTVMPVVVAEVSRRDIAVLRKDRSVVSVMIDEPVPPTMYESILLTGASAAHVTGATGLGTSVAVLDTGVAKTHPFLSNQIVAEACFSTANSYYGSTSLCPGGVNTSTALNSALPCPQSVSGCSHGTHVAGTIAGNRVTYGGQTMSGVAPDAHIIAVQVFSRFPASVCGSTSDCVMSYTSDQIAALDWLYRNATTASWQTLASVNMSLGGGKSTTACDNNGLKYYVDQLRSIGVATVIASGNNSYTDGVSAPACISSAIAVGASTLAKNGLTPDVVASFSNAPLPSNNLENLLGDRLLDVLAPGYWVVSSVAYPSGGYAAYAGTSMATPHVAGAWALLKSVSPAASVGQVLTWLTSSGVPITDTRAGTNLVVPRMQVDAAVRLASNETAPSATTVATEAVTETAIATTEPSATVFPTATRTATATALPTNTRQPTVTAQPTNTHARTATRQPTKTAKPKPTRKPRPTHNPRIPTAKPRP
ncbi:MAG: S8 family peptidase [Roseiflexaceae bacterium]